MPKTHKAVGCELVKVSGERIALHASILEYIPQVGDTIELPPGMGLDDFVTSMYSSGSTRIKVDLDEARMEVNFDYTKPIPVNAPVPAVSVFKMEMDLKRSSGTYLITAEGLGNSRGAAMFVVTDVRRR